MFAQLDGLKNYLVFDENHKIIKASEEICLQLGYEEKEVLNKELSSLLAAKPGKPQDLFFNKIRGLPMSHHQGIVLLSKQGKFITSDIYVFKSEQPEANNVFIMLLVGDLTYQSSLEKKYQEKSLELNTFIYKTSHNLRGPLCTISGLMELIKIDSTQQAIDNFIKLLDTTIGKLDHTLLDLINVAEANVGIVGKQMAINVNTVLRRSLRKIGESFNIRDNLFRVNIQQKNDFINYENLFSSVLYNLIAYAIQSLVPECPGMIKIDIQQHNDDSVLVCLTDNGKGIPKEYQGRVFEMFFKSSTSESSGLGLYLVKNYVEYMGGTVSAESESNQGKTIKLHVPSLKISEQKASG